jgi:hypothetical protein
MVGKDKGKQGNIAAFIRELNAVFVSGLNLVKDISKLNKCIIYLYIRKFNESVVVRLLRLQLQ